MNGRGRAGVGFAGLAMALFAAALPGTAQVALGTSCELRPDYREFATRQISPGNRITYIGGPYLTCPDGLQIQADSAVVYEASGRTELIGRVLFRHPERELDASLADYFEREGRLYARGDVRFLDVERGSEIEGDTLDFREANAMRPEDQLTVWGERSVALLRPSGEGVPEPDDPESGEADPYRIGADRLRFEGEDYFWGDGNVEVEREGLRATSDSLAFDQPGGQLILTGNAEVLRGEVRATGGVVNLGIRDDVLESLRTRREGRIETEDGTILTGDDVLVRLTPDEEIESVNAQGTDEVRATLEAESVHFMGRTIEIEGAQGETRIVRAIGQARGETDSAAPTLTVGGEDGSNGALVLDRNWLEGDEITATFQRLEPEAVTAASDPDAPDVELPESDESLDASPPSDQYELQQLQASGQARTLYRQRAEDSSDPSEEDPEDPADDASGDQQPSSGDVEEEPSAEWSISYIQADRILIFLVDGEVDRVEAEANGRTVDGIQLDPARGEDAAGGDGDSTGGAGR